MHPGDGLDGVGDSRKTAPGFAPLGVSGDRPGVGRNGIQAPLLAPAGEFLPGLFLNSFPHLRTRRTASPPAIMKCSSLKFQGIAQGSH